MVRFVIFVTTLILFSVVKAESNQHLDDREINARLQFLDSRLQALKKPSSYWQYGWSGFHGTAGAVQLYKAIDENDSDDEVKYYVGAAKSAGALAMQLLKPLPVVEGMNAYEQMPSDTREQKLVKLEKAESLLQREAIRANSRYTLRPHMLIVGVNLVGAAIIAALGDSDDALESTALGIAIGQASIWTQPSASIKHWDSYQQKFNSADKKALDWRIIPGHKSIALQVNF